MCYCTATHPLLRVSAIRKRRHHPPLLLKGIYEAPRRDDEFCGPFYHPLHKLQRGLAAQLQDRSIRLLNGVACLLVKGLHAPALNVRPESPGLRGKLAQVLRSSCYSAENTQKQADIFVPWLNSPRVRQFHSTRSGQCETYITL